MDEDFFGLGVGFNPFYEGGGEPNKADAAFTPLRQDAMLSSLNTDRVLVETRVLQKQQELENVREKLRILSRLASTASQPSIASLSIECAADLIDEQIFLTITELLQDIVLGNDESDPIDYRSGYDIYGQPAKIPNDVVNCISCERQIGVSRYAPHLEKCMGKGRTSSRVASKRIESSFDPYSKVYAADPVNELLQDLDQSDNAEENDGSWTESKGKRKIVKKKKKGTSTTNEKTTQDFQPPTKLVSSATTQHETETVTNAPQTLTKSSQHTGTYATSQQTKSFSSPVSILSSKHPSASSSIPTPAKSSNHITIEENESAQKSPPSAAWKKDGLVQKTKQKKSAAQSNSQGTSQSNHSFHASVIPPSKSDSVQPRLSNPGSGKSASALNHSFVSPFSENRGGYEEISSFGSDLVDRAESAPKQIQKKQKTALSKRVSSANKAKGQLLDSAQDDMPIPYVDMGSAGRDDFYNSASLSSGLDFDSTNANIDDIDPSEWLA